MRDYLSWGGLSSLHKLPVVKAATLVPVLGYVIIFSEALPDFFKYIDVIEVHQIIPSSIRLKMVYFGGVFIAFSMLLHYFFCPPASKKYANADQLREKYTRFGSPSDVPEALLKIGSTNYLYHRRPILLEGLMLYLRSYLSLTRGSEYETLQKTNLYQDLVSSFKGDKKLNRRDRFDAYLMLLGPSIEWAEANPENQQLRETSIKLLTNYLHASNFARPYLLALALMCAVGGTILIILPALETVYLVIRSLFV